MEFQTKIIEGNKNPKARIAWAGGGLLFLAMILMCVDKYQRYGFWMFGVAVVVLLAGAFLAKGDVDAIDVSAGGFVQGILCEAYFVCGAKCDKQQDLSFCAG